VNVANGPSQTCVGLEESPYPLAFVTDEGDARAVPEHERESSSFRCEVIGLGRFQKEGLVADVGTGRTWRLPADEGKYLRGTGLAPAPLMHWAAGLHGDVTSRIAHIARAESLILDELRVTVSQRFASKGSFARGEAVGLVFELAWEIDIVTEESEARVSSVVDRALRSSPANAAMVTGKEGRFGLHIDGRATPVIGLPQSDAATELYQSLRHNQPPRPAGPVVAEDTVLTTWPGANSSTVVLGDDQQGAIGWRAHAVGSYDFESGLVKTTVGFPEVAATEQWSLLTDATNRRAPSPLSYFSIGTAFCYHTQLCRYADVRHLPITSPRLVQTSHFSTSGGAAEARPFDTHLFVGGGIDDHQANSFLVAAANTCYAHRALSVDIGASRVTHVAVAASSGEGGR
jgi:uncharacterized OsmC-like protein